MGISIRHGNGNDNDASSKKSDRRRSSIIADTTELDSSQADSSNSQIRIDASDA